MWASARCACSPESIASLIIILRNTETAMGRVWYFIKFGYLHARTTSFTNWGIVVREALDMCR
jgi:hypothetical protein